MKKIALALIALFAMTIQASGMSYRQAREQALFLTDKMAYELNLTEEQYEAAYEVNLDYLMSIGDRDDLFGVYWTQRNLDLSYILFDWQYRTYVNAVYFYRPLYWNAGYWRFGVYARYPHRDYFYFGQPHFYVSYRGGHSWRRNSGRSWYQGRNFGRSYRRETAHIGMRDGFHRGDFGRGTRLGSGDNGRRSFGNGTRTNVQQNNGTRSFGRGVRSNVEQNNGTRSFGNGTTQNRTRTFGSGRQSSTRSTVTRPSTRRSFSNSSTSTTPRNTFTPNNNNNRSRSFGSSAPRRSYSSPAPSNRSFGSSSSSSAPSRSFGGNNSNRRSGGSTGGHFGRGR